MVGETEFEKSDLFRFLQIAERHGLPVYPSQAELMYVMARGEQSLMNGRFRIRLGAGEGVFVIPFTA